MEGTDITLVDDYKEIKTFANEILKTCEDKGFSIADVMYLPVCLKIEIDKQVNVNNFKNKFIKY